MLKTRSELPYSAELTHLPTPQQVSLENMQAGMATISTGLLNVRGRDGEAVLQRVYGLPALNVGDVAAMFTRR
jgi:hypothetical protein